MQYSDDQEERDDAQRVLVQCAQEYLHRGLREVAPGAILTLFWEEFYTFHASLIAGMVRPYFPTGPDRDDLIQDVWLAVTRKLPEFRWTENRNGFRAWFARVVHDKTVDLIRRRARNRTSNLGLFPTEAQQSVDAAEPWAALERRWQDEVVRNVLADLQSSVGDVNYQILHLHFWGNRTVSQIGTAVGLSAEQVSARQYRLLQKVHDRILAYCGADFTPVL